MRLSEGLYLPGVGKHGRSRKLSLRDFALRLSTQFPQLASTRSLVLMEVHAGPRYNVTDGASREENPEPQNQRQ